MCVCVRMQLGPPHQYKSEAGAYLAEPIHPPMITDTDGALFLEVIGSRCATGVMHDHGRLTALHDVYGHRIRAAEREDLRLAAPRARIAYGCAVTRVLARTDDARCGLAVTLALDARQEGRKVLGVR